MFLEVAKTNQSACRSQPLVAYCGEDGVVGIMVLEHEHDPRHRKPHVPIGAIRKESSRLLKVYSTDQIPAVGGLYPGGKLFRGALVRGAPEPAIHIACQNDFFVGLLSSKAARY